MSVAGTESDDRMVQPTSDIFTAVLWSAPKNEPILRDFLNAVLIDSGQLTIKEATVLNPFNIKEFAFDRQLVLDVLVKDETDCRYNIEVQTASHAGFVNRMLLQWADTYSSVLRAGDGFTQLVPVKSVVLTVFPIFPKLRNPHTIFEIRSMENPEVALTDHFRMHFLRLGDILKRQLVDMDNLFGGLRHWINFFIFADTVSEDKMTQLVENNPAVQAAYEELQRFSSNAEMREFERRRRRFQEDTRIYVGAARAEARAEGKAEGIIEGKAEGVVEREIEIAQNMKRKGFDVQSIADLTGLSHAEIERLG